ncbi:MAG: hypothetical protein M3Q88_03315 [Pseudomonadota bacterium]|nr:hypothetical protein [Pseudomonadota bacterium]
MTIRGSLRRWHMWLGWLVAVPMLFWTVSGFVMVARPIEEVRGTALLRDPAPLSLAAPVVAPSLAGLPVTRLTLEPRAAGPRWVIRLAGKPQRSRLADPATGQLLGLLGAAEAQHEIMARYTGKARVAAVNRVNSAAPPIDLNRPLDTWQVRMTDGTLFYVDAGSGEVVARRTRFWRVYDFMWGLHIMDLQGRKQTNNPWVVMFSLLAVVMTLMALVLLPLATRKGSRIKPR